VRSDEARDAGYLLGEALGTTTRSIGQVHDAVGARVFRLLGRPARPVQLVHDGIAKSVYGIVRQGTRVAPRVGGLVAARHRPPDAPSVSDSRAGNAVLGALNGAWGDAIAARYRSLAYGMDVRVDGRNVPVAPGPMAKGFPAATGRIVVFLHGLCETDDSWHAGSQKYYGDATTSFGSRLQEELGWTPVYLRYNTGLHISDNGRRFAYLMQALVDSWPVPVEDIALVGHSMGGLVMRSGCHYATLHNEQLHNEQLHNEQRAEEQSDTSTGAGPAAPITSTQLTWTDELRHVFNLGTPHLGAPLEARTAKVSARLARLPETAPAARLLNSRSVGVKDLRHGSLLDEDWADIDLDTHLDDSCGDVPFLPTAHYYFIGATLHQSPDHLLSKVLGDLLVLLPSASGKGKTRSLPFEVERGRHIGGLNHFHLLNHPAVYEQIRTWLMDPPAPETTPTAGEAAAAGQDAQK